MSQKRSKVRSRAREEARAPLYWAPYNGKNRHKTIIATIARIGTRQ